MTVARKYIQEIKKLILEYKMYISIKQRNKDGKRRNQPLIINTEISTITGFLIFQLSYEMLIK